MAVTIRRKVDSKMEILQFPEVLNITGLSRQTLKRYIDKQIFPKPIKTGIRKLGFYKVEVERWIATKDINRSNAPNRATLIANVLSALEAGAELTSWDCLQQFNSPWLSQCIYELRRKGHEIESTKFYYTGSDGQPRHYTRHKLVRSASQ